MPLLWYLRDERRMFRMRRHAWCRCGWRVTAQVDISSAARRERLCDSGQP
jgi:hypothetical protein